MSNGKCGRLWMIFSVVNRPVYVREQTKVSFIRFTDKVDDNSLWEYTHMVPNTLHTRTLGIWESIFSIKDFNVVSCPISKGKNYPDLVWFFVGDFFAWSRAQNTYTRTHSENTKVTFFVITTVCRQHRTASGWDIRGGALWLLKGGRKRTYCA